MMSEEAGENLDLSRRTMLKTTGAAAMGSVLGVSASTAATAASTTTDAGWAQRQVDAGNTGNAGDVAAPTTSVDAVWTYETADEDAFMGTDYHPFTTTQLVVGDLVVAATDDGMVYAFDVDSGAIDWQTAVSGYAAVEGLAARDGTIYAACETLVALDATDGSTLWEADRQCSALTVAGETLYGAATGVVSIDATDGSENWYTSFDSGATLPAVENGTVVAIDTSGTVHALDETDGTTRWQFSGGDSTEERPPVAVAAGTVYAAVNISSDRSYVYALDATDGSKQWENPSNSRVTTSPAVANGTVYVTSGTGSSVTALDADTGQAQWGHGTSWRIMGAPTIANGHIYVGLDLDSSPGGRVVAIDTADGTRAFSFDTGGDGDSLDGTTGVFTPPTLQNNAIYASSGDTIYKLESETDWTQYQADAGNTGHHSTVSPPTEKPSVTWVNETPDEYDSVDDSTDHSPYRSNTIVAGETAYISSGLKLSAVDTTDGSVRWTFEGGTDWGPADTLAYKDGILLTNRWKYLVAHDASDGSILWSYRTAVDNNDEPSPFTPTIVGDKVLLSSRGGIALSLQDGSEVWQYGSVNDGPYPAYEGSHDTTWLVHENGVAYMHASDDTLHAIDATDGSRVWKTSIGDGQTFETPTPAVANGTVFAVDVRGDERSYLRAIDADSGTEQWAEPYNSRITTSPAVADGKVIVTPNIGASVSALDTETGETVWGQGMDWRALGDPVVANGHVYVGMELDTADGRLNAFDLDDGSQAFSIDLPGKGESTVDHNGVYRPAVLQNGAIYVASGDRFYKLE